MKYRIVKNGLKQYCVESKWLFCWWPVYDSFGRLYASYDIVKAKEGIKYEKLKQINPEVVWTE